MNSWLWLGLVDGALVGPRTERQLSGGSKQPWDAHPSAGEGQRWGGQNQRPVSLQAAVDAAVANNADRIRETLVSRIGKARRQGFGAYGKTRESAERWDHESTAFLLTEQKGEYTALRVLPTATADAGGRTARISDPQLRERMKQNVVHRENGDVIITNLPMIDQGPKGFCVPATYARALL